MGLTLQNYLITLIVTKQVLKTAFPARYKVKIIFLDLLTELTAHEANGIKKIFKTAFSYNSKQSIIFVRY